MLDAIPLRCPYCGERFEALADASGYSEKHLSQMLTGANRGTLRSWETVLTAAVLLVEDDSIVDVALPTSDLRATIAGTASR